MQHEYFDTEHEARDRVAQHQRADRCAYSMELCASGPGRFEVRSWQSLDKALAYLEDKHYATSASTYGEPGYADPQRGILFANWNNVPKGLCDWLEAQGFELEWSDEWTTHDDRAYRTQPDCYAWEPSLIYTDDGDPLTRDDDPSDVIDALAMTDWNQSARCLPSWISADALLEAGYTLHAGELESGFHAGQTDDPAKLAKQAFANGAVRVAFRKLENSQFYIRFECYALFEASED
jgi:hypothetical protein